MQRTVLLFFAAVTGPALARPGARYRAAVVEISNVPINAENVTFELARKIKLQNAAMMEEWTAKAAAERAQIVVFGEHFADSGVSIPFGTQNTFAEPLPQPGKASLCSDNPESKTPLASAVACIARRHNITIATGLGDLGPCVHNLSPFTQQPFHCDRSTGLAAFNAIGVFGPDGSLLAKYHKGHLARGWNAEYEPHWAEVSPLEVAIFEAPFGVRFGMFICNDINFGGPTRALLEAGVRDIIFPTYWINFDQVHTAVGIQDSYSRAYGVNLLAANGNNNGFGSSGSGIWPADLSSTAPQHYTLERYVVPGQGWMGVADLVSPDPVGDVAAATRPPSSGLPLNGTVRHFRIVAGDSVSLSVSVGGLACNASVIVAAGSGSYALAAFAGLTALGFYTAFCAVVACEESSSDCDFLTSYFVDPDHLDPLPTGGAVFSDLTITFRSTYANTFLSSAICDGGLVVAPRSALALRGVAKDTRELQLSGASCPLMSAYIDGRAESEEEQAACPFNKYPCSTDTDAVVDLPDAPWSMEVYVCTALVVMAVLGSAVVLRRLFRSTTSQVTGYKPLPA